MKVLAVFASGEGSNFKAIHRSILTGDIKGEIALLVSNNPNCGAIQYADSVGITNIIINQKHYPGKNQREEALIKLLKGLEPDLIILAGYMKLIPSDVICLYEKRILNIHPALLPKFGGKGYYGMKVHEAVIQAGETKSGATVHFVNKEYDNGPIVAQKRVKITEGETPVTLADKVLRIEHKLYSQVVKAFCENRIIWKNNQPKIEVVIEN